MAEILVLHLAEKKAAAVRLADALAAAGYAVAPREVAQPQEIAELAHAADPASLLVWSRGAVSSAVQDGWLGRVRTAPGLVEVSFDGITPPYADESRVVLLSGWRGEPFHPGWQKVLERLKRMPLSQQAPAPPVEQPRPESRPAAPKAESKPKTEERASSRKPALVLGALLAVGAAAATATWIGGDSRDSGPAPAAERPPARAATPGPAPSQPPIATPQAPPASVPQAPLPTTGLDGPRVEPASEPPARKKAPAAKAAPRQAARDADGPVKRYSRRHSATMRAFCEGTGRSTPQCRTFLRSTSSDSSR
jgi:hypothetical protein